MSFDISVLDIINCLMNGMRLIFADDVENRDIGMMVALMAALFALCPGILFALYSIEGTEKTAYMTAAIRLFVISYPFVGVNFLVSFYWQAIKQQTLSAVLTALEGLVLPLLLVWLLSRPLGMNGVWAGIIGAEALATAFVFITMGVIRRKNTLEMGAFLLPAKVDSNRYDFSVNMQPAELVRLSREAGDWITQRLSPRQGNMTCLALEEMLIGIARANAGVQDVIDVSLRDTEKEIVISIRDMGTGFNPTVRDPQLDYQFDNAEVLSRIASNIEFDRSLGMNATRIHLSV